ncbi:unnamed protein product [Peniophora sp. CBMAI 1063]|nr:unnamed protein product [Peniophora sp. CBMAI 1063]
MYSTATPASHATALNEGDASTSGGQGNYPPLRLFAPLPLALRALASMLPDREYNLGGGAGSLISNRYTNFRRGRPRLTRRPLVRLNRPDISSRLTLNRIPNVPLVSGMIPTPSTLASSAMPSLLLAIPARLPGFSSMVAVDRTTKTHTLSSAMAARAGLAFMACTIWLAELARFLSTSRITAMAAWTRASWTSCAGLEDLVVVAVRMRTNSYTGTLALRRYE